MDKSTESARGRPIAPELDADRLTSPSDAAASAVPEPEHMELTAIAGEMAALSSRAEHASVEVAAIEVQMHDLADKLTAAAGVTFSDAPAEKTTDADAKTEAPVRPA